jgi:sirohydrochlorin cobaltochelatase
LSPDSAYLLVSHGSRDPRPEAAIATLLDLIQQHWQRVAPLPRSHPCSPLPLATAVLECSPQPLHEQICQFAATILPQGIRQIRILPLFLLPGVHVKQDIPEQLTIAQQQLGPTIELKLCPFLGSHPQLRSVLADRFAAQPADAYILLSHGSRRSGGNGPVEAIADQLGAVAAYWSVDPSLPMQVEALAARGKQHLAIFPYLMFPGGIVEAIAQQIAQLAQQFPHLQLTLMSPLTADHIAQLVVDLMQLELNHPDLNPPDLNPPELIQAEWSTFLQSDQIVSVTL